MLWERPTRKEFERLKDGLETLDERVSALKARNRTVDAKAGSITQRASRLENQVREILSYLHGLQSPSSADVDPDEPVDEEDTVEDRRLRVAERG